VLINRIRLDGLIYSLESFLQLNKCRELQIFAFVLLFWRDYYYYYYYYYYSEQSEFSRNTRSRTVRGDNCLLDAQTSSISGTHPVPYRQGHVTDPAPVTAQWQLAQFLSRLATQTRSSISSLSMNCNRQGLKNIFFPGCQSSAHCSGQRKGSCFCASCQGQSCWPGRGVSKAPKLFWGGPSFLLHNFHSDTPVRKY